MRLCAALALLLVCLSPAARAEADALAQARARFEAGRVLYQVGNYRDAIREFEAGYRAVPKPQFLINLGQCHRQLGELRRARELYQRFLNETPTAPEAAQVIEIVRDLDREIAALPPEAPPPPEPKAAPQPVVAAPAPVSAPPAVVAQAPPPKKSFIRRHWWIIPASAVVVGGAVFLGAWFGTQPSTVGCGDARVLGCFDARQP